jgi:hypothetical protein
MDEIACQFVDTLFFPMNIDASAIAAVTSGLATVAMHAGTVRMCVA